MLVKAHTASQNRAGEEGDQPWHDAGLNERPNERIPLSGEDLSCGLSGAKLDVGIVGEESAVDLLNLRQRQLVDPLKRPGRLIVEANGEQVLLLGFPQLQADLITTTAKFFGMFSSILEGLETSLTSG